ncbi:MAG: RNA polymerase sigma-70 factor [Bacteroidota bacterium]
MHQLNRERFEQLFRAEFKGLCFFAQKYVKDLDAAREIVQDSFLSLWEKRAAIDTSRPVKSYLTAVIHNKCHNYLRDNKKYDTNLLQTEHLLELNKTEETDILVTRELHQSIQEAIAELPEKCREIFLLNRYENLKYQQIAQKLGISVKTVEAQMSKALQHMRIRLAGYISAISSLLLLLRFLLSDLIN